MDLCDDRSLPQQDALRSRLHRADQLQPAKFHPHPIEGSMLDVYQSLLAQCAEMFAHFRGVPYLPDCLPDDYGFVLEELAIFDRSIGRVRLWNVFSRHEIR